MSLKAKDLKPESLYEVQRIDYYEVQRFNCPEYIKIISNNANRVEYNYLSSTPRLVHNCGHEYFDEVFTVICELVPTKV